jgi:hypothetical protein
VAEVWWALCRCRTLNRTGTLFRNYTERFSGYAREGVG